MGTLATNTFFKGMNLDRDYMYLENSEYIYASNIQVILNDNATTGAIQHTEGLTQLEVLPLNALAMGCTYEKIIGVAELRDYAVVFTEHGDWNSIYRINLNDDKTAIEILHITTQMFNISPEISFVTKWENDDLLKVYWADGTNPLRVVNVVEENIDYNLEDYNYNPNIPDSTLTFDSFVGGSLKAGVIQYAYQLFQKNGQQSEVSALTSLIHLTNSNTGSATFKGTEKDGVTGKGVKLHFVMDDVNTKLDYIRLYSLRYSDNYSLPEVSIVKEQPVASDMFIVDSGSIISEINYEEFVAGTNYSFIPKVIESKNDRLFAADIIEDTWSLPGPESDEWYDSRAFGFNRDGVAVLYSINGDRVEITGDDLDTGAYINSVPHDHDAISAINRDLLKPTYDFLRAEKTLFQRSSGITNPMWGGSGVNISYLYCCTALGEDYIGRTNTLTARNIGISPYTTSIRTNNSSDRLYLMYGLPNASSTSAIYGNYINEKLTTTGSYNYSNESIDTKYRSYQRDSLYRFGIVFYNKKGQTTPVNWIADIRMPSMNESEWRIFDQNKHIQINSTTYDKYAVVTYPMGLSFNVRNLPSDVTGIEIVRCKRTIDDRNIITQGLVTRVSKQKEPLANTPNMTIGDYANHDVSNKQIKTWGPFDYGSIDISDPDSVMTDANVPFFFTSPDICYSQDTFEPYLQYTTHVESLYGLGSLTHTQKPNGDTLYGHGVGTQYGDFFVGEFRPHGGAYYAYYPDFNKDGFFFMSYKMFNPFTEMKSTPEGPSMVTLIPGVSAIVDKTYCPTEPTRIFIPADNTYESSPTVNIGGHQFGNYTQNFTKTIGLPRRGRNGFGFLFTTDGKRDSFTHKFGRAGAMMGIGNADGADYTTYFGASSTSISNGLPIIKQSGESSAILTNLKRDVVPYGGLGYSDRLNSEYISIGAYYSREKSGVQLIVFGGDTYIGIMDYMHQFVDYYNGKSDFYYYDEYAAQKQYYYPCESSINLSLTHGSNFHSYANQNINQIQLQTEPFVSPIGDFTQTEAMYGYNSAYSANSNGRLYYPKGRWSKDDNHIDYRIHYSESKTNEEIYDNWTSFRPFNYIDVDTSYGSINNLSTYKNTLYFWQTGAFGALSVNQRSIIQDGNIGPLVLGTSDLIERYDYISTSNGSKDGVINNIGKTPSFMFWYDHNRAEIVSYAGSTETLSKVKGVQSYLNKQKENVGNHMQITYDQKYNDAHIVFDNIRSIYPHLVLNEQTNAFTSFVTYRPKWFVTLPSNILSVQETSTENKFYLNNSNTANKFFDGDVRPSNIQFVVNDNYPTTKVFDNTLFNGDGVDKLQDLNIYYETQSQTSSELDKHNLDGRYREYTYGLPIPRDERNNTARMRGKYLVTKIDLTPSEEGFKIPYIQTAYRVSNI